MIGRIRGTLVERSSGSALVDVGGVAYEILMAPNDVGDLPSVGEEVVVHTHLYVREDVQVLYGFTDATGRNLFRTLLGASGVGPKIALGMLATLGADGLRAAVVTDDVAGLTAVPGIGTRTAQKLILELRAKFEMPEGDLPGDGSGTPPAVVVVRQALGEQGFSEAEIRSALAGVDPAMSEAEMLRAAYKALGARS